MLNIMELIESKYTHILEPYEKNTNNFNIINF